MIIDSHLHVTFVRGERWEPLVELLRRRMERAGIDRTCLMPHPQFAGCIYPSGDQMRYQAETLSAIATAFPDLFYPLLFVCPMRPYEETLALMDEYVRGGPIVGAKFHISLLADHERYEPIYDYLESHDIPLLFHSWYKTVERMTFESGPVHIARMARKHPKLRILMAHLTGVRLRGICEIAICRTSAWIRRAANRRRDTCNGRSIYWEPTGCCTAPIIRFALSRLNWRASKGRSWTPGRGSECCIAMRCGFFGREGHPNERRRFADRLVGLDRQMAVYSAPLREAGGA